MVMGMEFPNIEDVLENIRFNQTLSPTNMTDCAYLDQNHLDVICQAPNWIDGVEIHQYPQITRLLSIQNTSLALLSPKDFENKTIHGLDISNNLQLTALHHQVFHGMNETLQVLRIHRTNLWNKDSPLGFFGLFHGLVHLKHLLIEDNGNLNLEAKTYR